MDIINAGITGPSFKATQNARRPLQRDTQGAPQSGTGSTRRSRSMLMPCGIERNAVLRAATVHKYGLKTISRSNARLPAL
jgi:hypothetical protein